MQSGSLTARLRRSAAIGALLTASCAPAFAQNSPQTPTSGVETVQPADQTEPETGDRVVITGSRIARDAFTSTAPIQVITAEQSTLEGLIDTAEILQGSSIAQGSTQFNNTFGNFVVQGGPASPRSRFAALAPSAPWCSSTASVPARPAFADRLAPSTSTSFPTRSSRARKS